MAHRTDLTVPVATHTTVQLPAAVRSHGTVPGSLPPSSTHLARGSLRRYGGTGTGRYGARLTSAAAVRCHGTGTVPGYGARLSSAAFDAQRFAAKIHGPSVSNSAEGSRLPTRYASISQSVVGCAQHA